MRYGENPREVIERVKRRIEEVKPGLLSFLESSLKNSSITIQAVLSEKEEQQNTLYTSEEKFEHMLKKNPNLVKLKERFNLDFE